MKRISLLKIMAFGVLALVHTACENAKYDVIDNLVYINEASTSKTKELTLTEGTTRTSLTVRLVNIINQTIKANLFIDESVLDAYNKKNETNYKMPPKEYISFPESVTIEAGSVSADPVNVDIKSFEAEGGAASRRRCGRAGYRHLPRPQRHQSAAAQGSQCEGDSVTCSTM